MCDFDKSFKKPEMVKPRPVIIMTPFVARRPRLCTVVPLSTTAPETVMPYNIRIKLPFILPHFSEQTVWVKADMIYAVSFDRLNLFRAGRDSNNKRRYFTKAVDAAPLKEIRKAMLHGLAMSYLTPYV